MRFDFRKYWDALVHWRGWKAAAAFLRMLALAQAFFAIFSLQASMFHTFGTGADWEHLMNILTGCGVCLLIVSIGIYMLRRGSRELQKRKETNDGESFL